MEGNQRKSKHMNIVPPYRNDQHYQKVVDSLYLLQSQGILCDVAIVAGAVEVQAHKVVLSACSPYFHAMFTNDLSESKADRVVLQEVDGRALELLIKFMYNAEISVNEDNVQVLLPAANLLQLPDVRDACCHFLEKQLHPSNCLGIMAFADLHSCATLYSRAQQYGEQHFGDLVAGEEFLSLSLEQVVRTISSDKLSVPTEESVFEAVLSWINHDAEHRSQHVGDLLEYVRLPLLSQEYLVERVEQEQLIKSQSTCKDLLIEAMKFHLMSGEQRVLFETPRTKPRTPVGLPKVMLVIGGQAPKAIRDVECYDYKGERWYKLQDMPYRRCRAGVVVANGLVYAVGGFNGNLRVRSVDMYNPRTNEWKSVQHMDARRSTLGAAVLHGLIYAVGGFDGSSGLNTVEVYDPGRDEWRAVASMNNRRSSVGVAMLGGYLYAVGGYDGSSRQCLRSVERYDPNTDTWSPVAEMSTRRSGAGVSVVGGKLYAVGGHDGPMVRKSVEVFDPEANRWNFVSEMEMCRRNAGVTSLDGYFYVVGGDDGTSNLASVERYDPKTDTWTRLPQQMGIGRSYSGVCVIDRAP